MRLATRQVCSRPRLELIPPVIVDRSTHVPPIAKRRVSKSYNKIPIIMRAETYVDG